MKTTWLGFAAAALGLSTLPLVACGSTHGESQTLDDTGSVSAAVSTTGPDGVTYSLPSGTNFVITRPGGALLACRSFIGNATTATFSFPAGTYNIGLSSTCQIPDAGSDAGSAGVPFTLNRSGDGGASTVSAVLLNPAQTVILTAGGMTPVVFNFTIQGLGTLTFGNGSANVGIATNPSTSVGSPTSGKVAGSFGPTSYTDLSSGAMPALTTLLSSAGTAQYNLVLSSLSPFTANFQDEICATFVASITTGAGTPAALQSLFAGELNGGSGTICFANANSSYAQNTVAIIIDRAGLANTPAFKTALFNGADAGTLSADFQLIMNAMTAPVYDGYSAYLGQFSSPVTLSNTFMSVGISNGTGSQSYGYVKGAVTVSLSLAP